MIIKFSLHARRRAKLYKISESSVEKIIKDLELNEGEHEAIKNVSGFRYPLKIVVAVEGDIMTVITNYSLKKGRGQ